jgi:phospholipid/cholesterol/gamma-HCH transport system permease protein
VNASGDDAVVTVPVPPTGLPVANSLATSRPARLLGAIGATARTLVTGLFGGIGRAWFFTREVVRATRVVSDWRPHVMEHARVLGVDSLPIGIFLAVFTGIVLALLASYSISDLVPLYFVGTLVQKTVTMELAPVLTGLALAGRVGANIAAQLGTMRVTEQVDALETLAYDPLAYLVVPRVIASTVMFPVVVGAAMLVGLTSGWLASIGLLDLTTPQFLKGVRLFFETFDVRYGLVKSASFGCAVALAGCHAGLATRGGAEGVGRAATRAVVLGAILILVLDAIWALVWLTGKTLTH